MKEATRRQRLDMLNGPIWNKLPQFALPVAATAILGQLFNAADIAVVGNFTGAEKTIAVAANRAIIKDIRIVLLPSVAQVYLDQAGLSHCVLPPEKGW